MTLSTIDNLQQKLVSALATTHVDVIDESHLHAGHAGARPGGNSHFRVLVVSQDFENVSRVKRHQMIYQILKDEMQSHIHALALTTLTPSEYEKTFSH